MIKNVCYAIGFTLNQALIFIKFDYLYKYTRCVAVAIFSFRFHVLYFLVGYQLTVSYSTKHENHIVHHTIKLEFQHDTDVSMNLIG